MIDIKPSIATGWGKGQLYPILKELQQFGMGLAGIQGEVYFVENNAGYDGNDGRSWDKAFKTLSAAITASNTNIAASSKGWAARNTIFCKGDRIVEDLTVFPTKCDVIGVGSCDAFKMCTISGNHAPVTTTYYGTRWINMRFEPAASGDIITLTNAGSGCEFNSCEFEGVFGAITAPSAIDSTAHHLLKILNCDFAGAFSGDVIDIGAGQASGTRIIGNRINGGADNGIVITGVATVDNLGWRGIIAHNEIEVADKVIDTRATSVFNCYDNICISGEAIGASSYVIDLTYAARNCITGAGVSVYVPSLTTVA